MVTNVLNLLPVLQGQDVIFCRKLDHVTVGVRVLWAWKLGRAVNVVGEIYLTRYAYASLAGQALQPAKATALAPCTFVLSYHSVRKPPRDNDFDE